jgi:hypothetical protein
MNAGRVVLVLTCLLVAGLGGWFAVARWDEANKVATMASALGAVAAVGVAVWVALREPGPRGSIRVSRTSRAAAGKGGRANTGVRGNAVDAGSVRVEHTGDAEAIGGDANTGVQLD